MSDRVQAIGRSKAEYARSIGFYILSDRGINRVVAFCLFPWHFFFFFFYIFKMDVRELSVIFYWIFK